MTALFFNRCDALNFSFHRDADSLNALPVVPAELYIPRTFRLVRIIGMDTMSLASPELASQGQSIHITTSEE